MFLSSASIRDLINNGLLLVKETIVDFTERMGFIEGSSFDLRVDKVFELDQVNIPFIGIETRVSSELNELLPIDFQTCDNLHYKITSEKKEKLTKGWYLPSGYYVLTTLEFLNTPREILGVINPRRTYIISGCPVICTMVSPGYRGLLAVGIHVINKAGLHLECGSNIVSCRFGVFDSPFTDSYAGIYGGSKVQTDGVERGK